VRLQHPLSVEPLPTRTRHPSPGALPPDDDGTERVYEADSPREFLFIGVNQDGSLAIDGQLPWTKARGHLDGWFGVGGWTAEHFAEAEAQLDAECPGLTFGSLLKELVTSPVEAKARLAAAYGSARASLVFQIFVALLRACVRGLKRCSTPRLQWEFPTSRLTTVDAEGIRQWLFRGGECLGK
jgi:hypothetical protein